MDFFPSYQESGGGGRGIREGEDGRGVGMREGEEERREGKFL